MKINCGIGQDEVTYEKRKEESITKVMNGRKKGRKEGRKEGRNEGKERNEARTEVINKLRKEERMEG